jgi:hypothetical protein
LENDIYIPNEESKVLRVEHLHIRDAPVRHNLDLTSKDINEPDEDEQVCDKGSPTEFGQITDQDNWQEDHGLNENEPLNANDFCAMCHAHDECLRGVSEYVASGKCQDPVPHLQVLGYKDDVGRAETDLRDDDRNQDEISEPWTIESTTNVYSIFMRRHRLRKAIVHTSKTARHNELSFHKEQERE